MNEIKVWDVFVRAAHWLLVLGFAVAYLSEGDPIWLHSWAGYIIAGVVLLRVLWGLVGTEHARFSSFVKTPATVVAYLLDLVRFRAKRHLGHSPAGGAMTLALLILLGATAGFGMADLAIAKGEGPLSYWLPQTVAAGTGTGGDDGEGEGERIRGPFKEVHEVLANITLAFVILHLGGVALASLAHRENLPRAMVTGRKRP